MQRLTATILFSALAALTACTQQTTEPAQPASSSASPTTQASATPETTPHPNQVAVSLGKTSAEAGKLNPRIAEAYSPDKVTLERTAAAPAGFPGAPEPQTESAPAGMKWVIVLVDLGATQGEFSMPLNKIRIVDQSGKPYRLVSFGGSEKGKFADLREYDKYKMVEPPRMMLRSSTPTKQNFLFAVPAKAEGLSFEF